MSLIFQIFFTSFSLIFSIGSPNNSTAGFKSKNMLAYHIYSFLSTPNNQVSTINISTQKCSNLVDFYFVAEPHQTTPNYDKFKSANQTVHIQYQRNLAPSISHIISLFVYIILSVAFIILWLSKRKLKNQIDQNISKIEKLKNNFKLTNIHLWEFNPESNDFQISESFFTDLNIPPQPINSHLLQSVLTKITLLRLSTYIKQCISLQNPFELQFSANINERRRHFSITGMADHTLNGKLLVHGCIQSLNNNELKEQLKWYQQEALKGEKLMSAFLANVSHELRTPLNSILGFSNILCTTDINQETKTKYRSIINSQAKCLLSLVDNIFDMAKIETGVMTIQPAKYKASDLFKEFTDSLNEKNFGQTKFKKQLNLLPNIYIEADKHKTLQILHNLVANANKFTKEHITVGAFSQDMNVTFFVEDRGPGIPIEAQSNIFTPFHKTNNLIEGGGLGLAISFSLAQFMNAKLHFSSEVGKGSTFYLTFNQIHKDMNIENQRVFFSNSKTLKSPMRVLIAEDMHSNFLLLETILSEITENIFWAKNGEEAIEICDTHEIDVVIMDIQMPLMDGFEATQRIKARHKDIPIIVLTAHAYEAEMTKAQYSGCDAYLSKPVDCDQLFETLQDFTTAKVK